MALALTIHHLKAIEALQAQGKTRKEIAQALNISEGLLEGYGIRKDHLAKYLPKAERDRMRTARILAKDNTPVELIALQTGLNVETIVRHIYGRRHKVPRLQDPPLPRGVDHLINQRNTRSYVCLYRMLKRFPIEHTSRYLTLEEYLATVAARICQHDPKMALSASGLIGWLEKGVPEVSRRRIAKVVGWDIAGITNRVTRAEKKRLGFARLIRP